MAQTIPLSVPDELLAEVRETAEVTNLSVQDVFRQSTKMGLPRLRESMSGHLPKPRRLSAWDALRFGTAGGELRIKAGTGKVKKIEL